MEDKREDRNRGVEKEGEDKRKETSGKQRTEEEWMMVRRGVEYKRRQEEKRYNKDEGDKQEVWRKAGVEDTRGWEWRTKNRSRGQKKGEE